MSNKPYAQVALTYLRRPFSSWLTGIATIGILCLGAFFIHSIWRLSSLRILNPIESLPLVPILLPIALLAGALGMHVKDQFTNSRSHLTPHFHRVNITVAAMVTLLLAVVTPGWATWWLGLPSVGAVAITTVLFGTMFWCVLMFKNWMMWPILALMLFTFSSSARGALVLIASGQYEVEAIGLLTLGVTIIILAGIRLARLNEDMPEYHRRMPAGVWAKGRMTGQDLNMDFPWPRAVTDWFRTQAMADLTRHVRHAAHSPWSRICRWQLGMPTGWRVWLWAIPVILLQEFLSWHLPHRMPSGAKMPMLVSNSLAMLPTILASTQSIGWLTLRMRTVDSELMLPVSRRAYVRQWSAAMAIGHFQLWGAICASTIAWWLLAAPITPPWTYLASVAAVALLAQIGLFGVISFAWIITGIRLLQMSAFIACIFALTLLVINGCDDIHAQLKPTTLPSALVAAALGLLLSYLGYRRRLVADFD